MKRVKKPKGNSKLSSKERARIVVYVTKKLFPRFAALLLTAVADVTGADRDTLNKIIDTTNRYAGYADDGLIDVEDIKESVEKNLGRKLEDVMKFTGE